MSHLTAKYLAPRLGALIALTPFSIDTYLPAMPDIANQMGSALSDVSITVPLFLIGFALGQLTGGPLSDRFGRKPIAILGLSIFFIASILMTLANNIDQLYWIRAMQAIGGGFATVVSSAIVRDLFSGKESARVFSMISLVMLIAPLVAPGVGSLILHFSHWHSIFVFLAFYAALLFLLVKSTLPETVTPERKQQNRQQPLSQLLGNYKVVLSNKRALGFLLGQGFASSLLFIYISESPFIYMEHFKVRAEAFPFYFGLVVLGVIFFNRVNIGLLKRYEPRQIALGAILAQTVFSILLIGYEWILPSNVFVVLLLMFFVIGLLGAVTPNILASYMDFFPKISGTANALIGSSIFAFGGIMGMLMSAIDNGTLQRVSSFTLLMSLLSLLSLLVIAKVRRPISID